MTTLSEVYAELERIVPRDMSFSIECEVWRFPHGASIGWRVWCAHVNGEGSTPEAALAAFRAEWGDRPGPEQSLDLASTDAALDVEAVGA